MTTDKQMMDSRLAVLRMAAETVHELDKIDRYQALYDSGLLSAREVFEAS